MKVLGDNLSDLHLNAGGVDGFEALGGDGESVAAGIYGGDDELAAAIGGSGLGDVCPYVSDTHGGA